MTTYTTSQTSRMTGISQHTLIRYARKIGVKRDNIGRRKYLWTEDTIKTAREMYADPKDLRTLTHADLLETLASVAEHGSYAAAGRQTYLNHVTVRYRVHQLEKRTGKQLVYTLSRKKGVNLTEAGRKLLEDYA